MNDLERSVAERLAHQADVDREEVGRVIHLAEEREAEARMFREEARMLTLRSVEARVAAQIIHDAGLAVTMDRSGNPEVHVERLLAPKVDPA